MSSPSAMAQRMSATENLGCRDASMNDRKAGVPRSLDDQRFAARDNIDRLGQLRRGRDRNDHGAVAIGMHEVAVVDFETVDADRHAVLDEMDMGVARRDAARKHLERGRRGIDVTNRTVGERAHASQAEVHVGLDLAPERAGAGRLVEVLDNRDRGVRRPAT